MAKALIVVAILGAGLLTVVVIAAMTSRNSQTLVATQTPAQPGVTNTPQPELNPIEAAKILPLNQITLTIDSPVSGASVTMSSVVVKGRTTAGADVGINDVDVKADSKGNFSAKVNLDEGENIITVVANDSLGNVTEKDLTVTMESPLQ